MTNKLSADNPLPTTGQTVVDLPPTHVCRIDGCGLEFTIEYTLIAHQRAVHKTTAPTVHFGYDTSGVGGSDSAVGLAAGSPKPKRKGNPFYKCSECYETFDTKADLKSHWRDLTAHLTGGPPAGALHWSAAPFKPYDCLNDGCGQLYVTLQALKIHRRSVHSAPTKQYGCDGCTKTYYTKHMLEKHWLTVHSAVTDVLQASNESVVMDTTVADDRPVETTTVLPVHSITVTINPNNSAINSDREVIDVMTKRYDCLNAGCGQTFTTKRAIRIHQLFDHSDVGGQYWYDYCTKTYDGNKQRLTVHSAATHVNFPSVSMDTTVAAD
ncbi:unnamed protein product [Medioppia subpectinata]|uniref:C2H2-type domain-containing protein n=1 Tax=Medioppia subpectinata TaxID=1979941 RepID=A0A7R9QAR4_9ACAR|nr:unnamed protein product [Medioppia subpectinata]CAG2117495.1 unnamed protein product [Medioppia subpectinata]